MGLLRGHGFSFDGADLLHRFGLGGCGERVDVVEDVDGFGNLDCRAHCEDYEVIIWVATREERGELEEVCGF